MTPGRLSSEQNAASLIPLAAAAGLTVLCTALARLPATRARRAIAWLLIVGCVPAVWPFLPRDGFFRLWTLIAAGLTVIGNLVAMEARAHAAPSTVRDYLWDVVTVGSSRLVPEQREKGVRLAPRFLRGVAFGVAAALVVLSLQRVPPATLPVWLWCYLKLQAIGLGVQSLSDVVFVVFRGEAVPQMKLPMLSTSLLDFWGRRYNLWVHGVLLWIARDLLGQRRRPLALIAVAFLVSGALHEVMSFGILGAWKGYWMAFWVAQVVLTLVSVKLERLFRGRGRRIVGTVMLHASMMLSAPLFFAVTDQVMNLFGPITKGPW